MIIDAKFENELRNVSWFYPKDLEEIIGLLNEFNKDPNSKIIYYTKQVRSRLSRNYRHKWFKNLLYSQGLSYKYIYSSTVRKITLPVRPTRRPNVIKLTKQYV